MAAACQLLSHPPAHPSSHTAPPPLICSAQGLNVDTQQALLATGLPLALCRLLVRAPTPEDQRMQVGGGVRVEGADRRGEGAKGVEYAGRRG